MPQPPPPPSKGEKNQDTTFLYDIRFEDIVRGELLGKGSFGTVYRAVWRAPDGAKEVAIKYFETDLEKAEFHVERRQLARVNHPNIIRLYGACTSHFILLVMEYAECGSLYKVLHQAKPQPEYNAGHAVSLVNLLFVIFTFFICYCYLLLGELGAPVRQGRCLPA